MSGRTAPEHQVPELLREIVAQHSNTPMAVVRNLVVLEANDALATFMGAHSPEEVRGLDVTPMLTPASRDIARERFQRRAAGEVMGEAQEYQATTLDGRDVYFELSAISWPPDPLTTLTIVRDITEIREAEQALQKKTDELAAAYDSQKEFIRNIIHDVRTPMTSVTGYARMLLEGLAGPLNEEQRSMLGRMLVSAETLLRMMDTLVETARLGSGITQLKASPASPGAIARSIVETLYPQAAKKGLSLVLNARECGDNGLYDADKIRMLLINLLSNAIKYTETGGVEVSVSTVEGGAEIVVTDSGVGIPEGQLASAFEEYRQLNQQNQTNEAGFGLGLSIVHRLISVMEATLVVSSAAGVGTAFTVFIPAVDGGAASPNTGA
jgi:PAS domain S-box-containing protein